MLPDTSKMVPMMATYVGCAESLPGEDGVGLN